MCRDTTTNTVIPFPRTAEMINRDMDKIVDQSKELLERSEALLRWAEDISLHE